MKTAQPSQHTDESPTTAILEALSLAAAGELTAAERALAPVDVRNMPAEALDALARIALCRGQLARARDLWSSAVKRDPSYAPAQESLATMQSTWLAKAVLIRLASLAIVPCIAAIVFYAGRIRENTTPEPVVIVNRGFPPNHTHTQETGKVAVISPDQLPHESAEDVVALTPVEVVEKPKMGKSQRLPTLLIDGCVTSVQDGRLVIVFNEGIFRYRCEFTGPGETALKSVIAALTNCPPVEQLVVVGHTDNEPMPPGGPYLSNYALGFARAATVAAWFRQNTAVPAEALVATSRGSENPPFSNDNYDSRLRNRTVVLRFRFAQEKSDMTP